ncbi:MAG: hypothetical protein JXR53_00745 [Bacteroidales bacterium]|nr:hypothetical protein [Bacteroidales bacterium]
MMRKLLFVSVLIFLFVSCSTKPFSDGYWLMRSYYKNPEFRDFGDNDYVLVKIHADSMIFHKFNFGVHDCDTLLYSFNGDSIKLLGKDGEALLAVYKIANGKTIVESNGLNKVLEFVPISSKWKTAEPSLSESYYAFNYLEINDTLMFINDSGYYEYKTEKHSRYSVLYIDSLALIELETDFLPISVLIKTDGEMVYVYQNQCLNYTFFGEKIQVSDKYNQEELIGSWRTLTPEDEPGRPLPPAGYSKIKKYDFTKDSIYISIDRGKGFLPKDTMAYFIRDRFIFLNHSDYSVQVWEIKDVSENELILITNENFFEIKDFHLKRVD